MPWTHLCTRECPRPIVNFVVDELGGPVLSYTINLNSHGKGCLNRCFYRRKNPSVKSPRGRSPQEMRPPAWLCVSPGRSLYESAKLTPASKGEPSDPPPSSISQKAKLFHCWLKLYFLFSHIRFNLTSYQDKNVSYFSDCIISYFSDHMLIVKKTSRNTNTKIYIKY